MESENGICLDFLQEAVARFPEDDSFIEIFVKSMVDISTKLGRMTMNENYKPYVNVSFYHSSSPSINFFNHQDLGPEIVLEIPFPTECSRKAPFISDGSICTWH